MAMMLEDAGGGGALMLLAVSFIPGIVASFRNQHQQTAVYMLNLLLGWSVLCWIALVWAEFAFPPTINTPGSMVAAAVPLAVILHLVIVLLIGAIDRKKPGVPLESAGSDSLVNVVLIVFSAAFLALTVLSGDQWDYTNLPRGSGLTFSKAAILGITCIRTQPQCLRTFVQPAGPFGLVQPAREQAFVRVRLSRLRDLANQGFWAAPRIRDLLVPLDASLAPEPVSLVANCVSWIFRHSGGARLRRSRPLASEQ